MRTPPATERRARARAVPLLAVLVLWWVGFNGLRAEEPKPIRIVGSDLLGLEFSRALYAFAADEGIPLALALDGSRPAIDALRAGRASAAILALPANETFADTGYEVRALGYHAVFVLAPTDCPLDEIPMATLRGLFGRSGAAPIERWSDLGVKEAWASDPVTALAPEPGATIAVELFRVIALNAGSYKTNVERYRDEAELLRCLGSEARPVALAAWPPAENSKFKVLRVSARDGVAVAPTTQSLHRCEYPFQLPVRVVYRSDADETVKRLIRHLFSDEAATLLRAAAVMPIPAEVRAAHIAAIGGP